MTEAEIAEIETLEEEETASMEQSCSDPEEMGNVVDRMRAAPQLQIGLLV